MPHFKSNQKSHCRIWLEIHASPTIFSPSSLASIDFLLFIESLNGTKAYFKRREEVEMMLVSFFDSKLAKFHEGIRKLMARWKDVINQNSDYVEH
ncbi:hypothetical protein ACTXT7_010939 [Hymenolepis weldensis]